METALLVDRRWTAEAWTDLFVKNPIMHSFSIGLIWAAYADDRLEQTFRYMEDGSFNTADGDEYSLPENCTIGLVHPIDLDEAALKAWKQQLSDYEITQPIDQINRPVYLVEDNEKEKPTLERYKGKTINGLKLMNRMTKLGWSKGSVLDAGFFYEFYREDVIKRVKNENGTVLLGNAVSLKFSGMYVGYDVDNEDVTIEEIRFYKIGTVKRGSYIYDEAAEQNIFPLGMVSKRYFSKIIAHLEMVLEYTNE